MRTIIIIVGGFVLLGLAVLAARWIGTGTSSMVTAAKVFIPVWLVAALVNLWLGTKAGYSVTEELPILLLIFAAPAAVAALLWWKFS